jgi:hypothetical protein
MKTLSDAIQEAQRAHHLKHGKCSICAVGDRPQNGLHMGKYRCGNNDPCILCHNAGMEFGDQCAACGRVEMH